MISFSSIHNVIVLDLHVSNQKKFRFGFLCNDQVSYITIYVVSYHYKWHLLQNFELELQTFYFTRACHKIFSGKTEYDDIDLTCLGRKFIARSELFTVRLLQHKF